MIVFLAFICAAFAGVLTADYILLNRTIYFLFPRFAASAAALTGLLIAGLEYRARKGKKKKRAPLFCLLCNALIGALSTGIWIYLLLV